MTASPEYTNNAPEISVATPDMNSRRLLLMRHAKSDWSDEGLSDHDRPLNRRGLRDAPRMAQWIGQLGDLPDQILCSSSARTVETSQLLVRHWEAEIPVRCSETLYLASPQTILSEIQSAADDADTLLVIGHNPGIAALASGLAGQMIDMPTAAIAVFGVDVAAWARLDRGDQVRLIDSIRPKAL